MFREGYQYISDSEKIEWRRRSPLEILYAIAIMAISIFVVIITWYWVGRVTSSIYFSVTSLQMIQIENFSNLVFYISVFLSPLVTFILFVLFINTDDKGIRITLNSLLLILSGPFLVSLLSVFFDYINREELANFLYSNRYWSLLVFSLVFFVIFCFSVTKEKRKWESINNN
ncbi:MAG: hypothetical protein WDZ80_03860 [Candidatus Paceibacterota bacterium]